MKAGVLVEQLVQDIARPSPPFVRGDSAVGEPPQCLEAGRDARSAMGADPPLYRDGSFLAHPAMRMAGPEGEAAAGLTLGLSAQERTLPRSERGMDLTC